MRRATLLAVVVSLCDDDVGCVVRVAAGALMIRLMYGMPREDRPLPQLPPIPKEAIERLQRLSRQAVLHMEYEKRIRALKGG